MNNIKISVKNLNIYYGNFLALKDITLDIPEKSITAIIGPSGCGKSTFLRALNRMNELLPNVRTEGEVILDGQNIYNKDVDLVSLRRKVGMVFQRPNPFPKSIFENVAFGLRIQGIKNREEIEEIVELSLRRAALWDEVKETGYNAPKEPIFFSKSVSSIIGHDERIIYPTWLTRVDPEVELGVIIGKKAKNIPEETAINYVLGYTIINDVTARDMQTEDLKISNPWFRSKSFDTFCPIGPYLVLKEQVQDPHNLNIELRVNGTVRQKDNTKNLIFKIPYIISYITRHMTLEPGDIIATGTPSGIAPIKPGDIIEAEIEGIGILKNIVVEG